MGCDVLHNTVTNDIGMAYAGKQGISARFMNYISQLDNKVGETGKSAGQHICSDTVLIPLCFSRRPPRPESLDHLGRTLGQRRSQDQGIRRTARHHRPNHGRLLQGAQQQHWTESLAVLHLDD